MEVAIANVADQEVWNAAGIGFRHRVEQAVGQSADGHASVRTDGAATRLALKRCKVSVVACRPKASAFFWGGGPLKGVATLFAGKLLHGFGLFFDAGWRAMKLHQQQSLFAQAQLGVGIDHAHSVVVDQLHPCDGHAQLNGLNHGLHSRRNAGERANGRGDCFRQWIQADRDLGHHAQGAFAADKQARQVVACTGFFGTGACSNDFPRCGNDFQGQNLLTHGAIPNGIGATGAGCAHAADGGICSWIDGEKQTGRFDFFVQLLARNARLNCDG